MPSVLDSFVLELSLDPRQFEQGQREAMSAFEKTQQEALKWGKGIEEQGKQLSSIFRTLKGGLVGIMGAFVGVEAAGFIDSVAKMDASMGRISASIDMSAGKMALWRGIVMQFGGSAQEASQQIGSLANTLLTAATGGGMPNAYLARLLSGMDWRSLVMRGDYDALLMGMRRNLEGMSGPLRELYLQQAGISGALQWALLSSPEEFARRSQAARRTEPTAADIKAAQDYVAVEGQLAAAGMRLAEWTFPALTRAINAATDGFDKVAGYFREAPPNAGTTLGGATAGAIGGFLLGGPLGAIIGALGGASLGYGLGNVGTRPAGTPAPAAAPPGTAPTPAQEEAYIRRYAASIGIDPDMAVARAKAEGLYGYVGDKGSSFGPYQLHYGGMVPGMMQAGLGDLFTKQTGLNARDQSTWEAQIRWYLNYAKAHGWGDLRSWHGSPWAGIGAVGAGAAASKGSAANRYNTSSVTIGQINVTSNKADPKDVAAAIPDQVKLLNTTMGANYALE
jgi:hypothetical protein